MTAETVKVTVEMIFTTDNGEVPEDNDLARLIGDQMYGELDEETGLGCMSVNVVGRTGELE